MSGAPLPVRSSSDEIVRRLSAPGSTLTIVAETGSGKTTQVPQILDEAGLSRVGAGGGGRIVVLQPRRLAARAVARRVAQEMGTPLGEAVGYRTRHDRADCASTRILFMTDGLFARLALASPRLEGIGTVVLDEFHERGIHTDISAGTVRRLQSSARPDLRLVIMSATLDVERTVASFGGASMRVAGRVHPVQTSFAGDPPPAPHGRPVPGSEVWSRAADAAMQAMEQEPEGHVLIFMPGRAEIARTVEALGRRLGRGSGVTLHELHGSQTAEEQDAALAPTRSRKVIVATNIAQTSLTIDGVRVVIDSGLARVARFDPRRDLNALRLEPISRASAEQRAGRAGRTAPGRCIRLWSVSGHARRAEHDEPEIARVELSEAILLLAALGERDALGFPWVDAPPAESLERARGVLRATGAFGADDRLTPLGKAMARIPTHPRLARALVEADRRGCVRRAAACSAIVAGRDVLRGAPGSWIKSIVDPDDPPGDLAPRERLLALWSSGSVRSLGVAAQQEIDSESLREAARVAEDLARAAKGSSAALTATTGARPVAAGGPSHGASGAPGGQPPAVDLASSESDHLVACLVRGFPDRIAWRTDPQKPHAHMAGRRKVAVDPASLLRGTGPFLALDAREATGGDGSQTLLSLTCAADPALLESLVPERFTVARGERWDEQEMAVVEVEERMFDGIATDRTVRPARNVAAAEAIIAERIADGALKLELWDESVEQWIARVRCAAQWMPESGLITYAPDELRVVLMEIASGATRWSQVRGRPCLDALRHALSHDEIRLVERAAPSEIALPSGRRMRVHYEPGQPPRGRAKVQDLYGLERNPTVAMGRVPVLLEILGPNFRPLQVTADLANFWSALYPSLRNELRRRYPRHEWR
jgi:ATP-dependent helicase HrpB